ncbi:Scr1 family TA system antitoxin-like transcriptional regulator [Amycolatopsis sp. OK19-0408]|uniref:Scr1 family TA system antitoxin-like transcriptional regulator n=1 Tax=Amycolatopsis iheyensis TaxID=2945988 RepID=A0A9X2NJ76_9PSEU|nr:Scr1 family TA system antitoxin-like transcriptional regulator [Amycolatopsis iheyensis]MCR6488466.1 Scr1 family TA system antitoxin-like transcriptional regulator [Amycolatopsis iheyensis]
MDDLTVARPPSLSPQDDNEQRRLLGLAVRELRKQADLTQEALAKAAHSSQGAISRLERGYVGSSAILEGVLAALAPAPEVVAELRRLNLANERGQEKHQKDLIEATTPWFGKVLELEPRATAILSWTGERVKGLLQAESYMVELFRGSDVDSIADAVTGRAARATRAFIENAECRYEFLISESAVDRLVRCETSTKYVAVDQLKHLVTLVDRNPNIGVRLVPYAKLLYVEPDFTIMEFAPPEAAFGYSDLLKSLVTTEPSSGLDLDHLRECWAKLSHSALGAGETRDALEKALRRCQESP